MSRSKLLPLGLLLASCASEPTGYSPDNLPQLPDLAAVSTGDSLPSGAVSFFNRKDCPAGWRMFDMAIGRTIVPSAGSETGVVQGTPLDEGEIRTHSHAMTATLKLSSVDYAGIAGEANHSLAHDGTVTLKVMGAPAAAGLPYVQLLVCQKSDPPPPTRKQVPAGTRVFFTGPSCPQGWGETKAAQGRFIVGVPEQGKASQNFGGAPLASGEKRTHRHTVEGKLQTSSQGIALLSGGLAGGYAKNDNYPYQGSSDEGEGGMPYIQLLQCQKL